MQELFTALFWNSEEISHTVARLCDGIPGCQSAREEYEKAASQIRELVGFELYNRFMERLTEYSHYEECAYYATGLGLREAVFKALCG